ncbi:MAG: hypothetical protein WCH35_06665 [Comamonadaceae bacterium]
MKILRGIERPVAGEHVLATWPALGPYATGSVTEPGPRKRLHFFPQRSLTHTALIEEQRSRITDAMRLGQSVSPGVIDGLELVLDGLQLVLLPGHAIAPDGQDLELAYALHVPFDAVTVISPLVEQALQSRHTGSTPWQRLSGLQRQVTLAQALGDLDGASFLPHAMVLVAIPRSIALDRGDDSNDGCPNATDQGASLRAAWEDGFQLAWVPWPQERSLPLWSNDASTLDPRFRNRLAYAVFNTERERLSQGANRSLRAWKERAGWSQTKLDLLAAREAALLAIATPWPWETLGVPLSVVAFDAAFKPAFADRAAVVRQGGGRHNRSPLVPRSGDDVLWQARISQLLEQLAEMPADQRNAPGLAQQFDWLPPAGVLPRDSMDFLSGRQNFFPPQFDVQAQPVPIDMVDALMAESSPLLPYNLSLRDQVQILVPVPARFFDPDLLRLDERVHPLFDLEIARLSGERLQLLTRRDGLRRRFDVLSQAVGGQLPRYLQADPNALADESAALDAQAFARVHRSSAEANAAELHQFSAAHHKLVFQASDELIVFVRVDSVPAGIGVRPLISQAGLDGVAVETHPFVWGTAPAEANGERLGELPVAGVWSRLSIPMARAGLAGQKIDGLAFAIFSGAQSSQVTWGYAGKATNGVECYWLCDALPTGASLGSSPPWTWVTQGDGLTAAEDASFGLSTEPLNMNDTSGAAHPDTRHVSELDTLLASWKSFREGVLTVELGEPAGGARTATTPPRTIDAGLDELIQRLDGRIRAAGDHVDLGFLRARTDIFRLRQGVLGVEDAGRFMTSPAASELLKRNENPVATEKEFSDYFSRLNQAAVQPPDFKGPQLPTQVLPPNPAMAARTMTFAASAAVASRAPLPVAASALSTNLNTLFGSTEFATSNAAALSASSTGIAAARLSPIDITGVKASGVAVVGVRPVQLGVAAPPAITDVVGASLMGATYNTVTVAERFTLPASVVSSNSAAKGKNDFVVAGLKGLQATGMVVNDLPVFGYQKSGTATNPTTVSAAELMAQGSTVTDVDGAELSTDLHEAVYFRRGIEAIDNTIRFLRGMELRAEDYRRLQSDAQSARQRISAVIGLIQSALASLSMRLAEVRHDLSVAQALREEEQSRVDALLARRRAILVEQVPYLVFRRPRLTLTLQDLPLLATQPAVVDDPVPRWRSESHEAPAELTAMVDTLRDVPVRWLLPIARIFVKLDRVIDIEQVVMQAQQRLVQHEKGSYASKAVKVLEGEQTSTGAMLADTFERHAQRIVKSYDDAAVQLTRFDASSWRQAIEPVQSLATMRDLMQAGSLRREVTLAASGLLDDVAGVASGLHASLCSVPPATRLRWAEAFSQLDPSVSLRVLTVLPGFGDERLGVDYIVWRQMQQMVDWLFAQVSSDAGAQDAINDLVRVCLLLASHAPVKRIISARIRRPVPAIVNTRLDIEIDPKLTRIGMQVLVYAPATQTPVARAVIEDLANGGATARITHVPDAVLLTLDSSLRVQVQSGPPLTTATVQRSEATQALADAMPASAAPAAAVKATQQAVQAASEQRIAKQVEVLRDSASRGGRMR